MTKQAQPVGGLWGNGLTPMEFVKQAVAESPTLLFYAGMTKSSDGSTGFFWVTDLDRVPCECSSVREVAWTWEEALAQARLCHASYGVYCMVEDGERLVELEEGRPTALPVPRFA